MDLQLYLQEAPPHQALLEFLFKDQPPSLILDVGCCEGEDSLRYLQLFADARVIGFEPYPPNANKARSLLGKLEDEGRFTLVEAAVADQEGVAILSISSGHPPELPLSHEWDYGNKSSSLLPPAQLMAKYIPWLNFTNKLEVPTITLDGFARQHGISAVDLIHIDIQGAELKAFAGAAKLLAKTGVIWAEVADHELYEGQPTAGQVTAFLANAGFSLVLCNVDGGFGDHFYVNPKYFHIARHDSRL